MKIVDEADSAMGDTTRISRGRNRWHEGPHQKYDHDGNMRIGFETWKDGNDTVNYAIVVLLAAGVSRALAETGCEVFEAVGWVIVQHVASTQEWRLPIELYMLSSTQSRTVQFGETACQDLKRSRLKSGTACDRLRVSQ